MIFLNYLLLIIFICLDFNNLDSSLFKYLITINNFIYLLIHCQNKIILKIGLFIVIADFFLLFTTNYDLGVFFFVLVQSKYMHLLSYQTKIPWLFSLGIFYDLLISLALIYASFSLFNLFYSLKFKQIKLFLTLLLLLCCDIIIALSFLTIINPSFLKISWLFYFPSQLIFIKSYGNY